MLCSAMTHCAIPTMRPFAASWADVRRQPPRAACCRSPLRFVAQLQRVPSAGESNMVAVGMGPWITRQGFVARGRIGRRRSRNVVTPVRAMGDETMWITASSAVALVVALAAFAALGGYLLSIGVDNETRSEEESIERLKEQGLYEKPEPTPYEEQGVGTRTRKRRISED